MNLALAFIILLNSMVVFAAPSAKTSATSPKASRAPAAAQCETPAQLMASGFQGKEFTAICKKLVAQDDGCKKLKPEKRMNCSTKSANNILSSNELSTRIGQCIKGFVWDSMVDLAKFVIEIVKTLVGAQINSVIGMAKFLTDSEYREKTLAATKHGAGAGFKLAKAFLNSSAMYFAREFPKNLRAHPFNPLMALGTTLMKPLITFLSESVQQIAAYYIPQFQCMNGTAKLYTICRTLGDFIMPPAFIFSFLKNGINGLRLLKNGAQASKIARVEKRFAEANELREVAVAAHKVPAVPKARAAARIVVDEAPKSAARTKRVPRPVEAPRTPAEIHPVKAPEPAPLARPIEEHTPDELIELARSEQAESRAIAGAKPEAVPEAAPPKAADEVPTPEEQAGRLVIESQIDDLITGTKNAPELIVKYAEDPEYSALFKVEKQYPEQSRDVAIVISDMEKRNPKMSKSEVREEVQKFLNTCELKR